MSSQGSPYIAVCGDGGVGKTALLRCNLRQARYIWPKQRFRLSCVNGDTHGFVLRRDVAVWAEQDSRSSERELSLCLRKASAVILMYSLMDPTSWAHVVHKWVPLIWSVAPIPILLVGTHVDKYNACVKQVQRDRRQRRGKQATDARLVIGPNPIIAEACLGGDDEGEGGDNDDVDDDGDDDKGVNADDVDGDDNDDVDGDVIDVNVDDDDDDDGDKHASSSKQSPSVVSTVSPLNDVNAHDGHDSDVEADECSSWNRMPTSIVLRVLEYLAPKHLFHVMLTCKQWLLLAKHAYTWSYRLPILVDPKDVKKWCRSIRKDASVCPKGCRINAIFTLCEGKNDVKTVTKLMQKSLKLGNQYDARVAKARAKTEDKAKAKVEATQKKQEGKGKGNGDDEGDGDGEGNGGASDDDVEAKKGDDVKDCAAKVDTKEKSGSKGGVVVEGDEVGGEHDGDGDNGDGSHDGDDAK